MPRGWVARGLQQMNGEMSKVFKVTRKSVGAASGDQDLCFYNGCIVLSLLLLLIVHQLTDLR